jgi:hypothetical protein
VRCGFVDFVRAMRSVASMHEQTRIGLDYWAVVCAMGHMSSSKEKLHKIFSIHVNTGEYPWRRQWRHGVKLNSAKN